MMGYHDLYLNMDSMNIRGMELHSTLKHSALRTKLDSSMSFGLLKDQ